VDTWGGAQGVGMTAPTEVEKPLSYAAQVNRSHDVVVGLAGEDTGVEIAVGCSRSAVKAGISAAVEGRAIHVVAPDSRSARLP